jgi:streptogramin lyase
MTTMMTLLVSGPLVCLQIMTSPVGTGQKGFSGDDGSAAVARLDQPFDVAFDPAGRVVFTDTGNHRVRRVDGATGTITTVAGSGRKGFSGDGGPATSADLDEPYGLAIASDGTIYFADRLNARVRKIDGASGLISTVAGTGAKGFSGDGGPATEAGLVEPNGVALAGGLLYIADVSDHRVRVVDLGSGKIRTFAGTGKGRHDGDNGPARDASLFGPRAVEVGPSGVVYIVERNGHRIRSVEPGTLTIRTIAGTGQKGYTGDGGAASQATFDGPKELALDPDGNLYVVDTENHAIRRIDAATGKIVTVAGDGTRGPKGDGGRAIAAQLDRPHGAAIAPDGSLWIGDTNNHRLRRVRP